MVDTERERSFGLRHVLFRSVTRGYQEDARTCQTFLRKYRSYDRLIRHPRKPVKWEIASKILNPRTPRRKQDVLYTLVNNIPLYAVSAEHGRSKGNTADLHLNWGSQQGHVSGHFSLSRRSSLAVRTNLTSATRKRILPLLGHRIM